MQTISITNIIGHIGSDPQFATLPNGTQETTISVATNMRYWRSSAYSMASSYFLGKTAEAAAKLKKAMRCTLQGCLNIVNGQTQVQVYLAKKAEINVQQFSKVENPMQTINQINILGNLGSDAQFKQFQDNAENYDFSGDKHRHGR